MPRVDQIVILACRLVKRGSVRRALVKRYGGSCTRFARGSGKVFRGVADVQSGAGEAWSAAEKCFEVSPTCKVEQ